MKKKVNGSFSSHVAGTVYVLMLEMDDREAEQFLERIKAAVTLKKDAPLKKRFLKPFPCPSLKRKGLLIRSSAVLSPTSDRSFPYYQRPSKKISPSR